MNKKIETPRLVTIYKVAEQLRWERKGTIKPEKTFGVFFLVFPTDTPTTSD